MTRAPLAALILILTGCAAAAPPPPRDLLIAESELGRALENPYADGAIEEIGEAEVALQAAEREARDHPLRAADAAYVARRRAESARVAALYAADRQALEKARGAARRIGERLDQRDAQMAATTERQREAEEAMRRLVAARRASLEGAAGGRGVVVARDAGLVMRFPMEVIFLPGTSLLRDGAEACLAALALALRSGPACDVRIDVLDDVEGFRTDAFLLAERRRSRVHDVLITHGIPAPAFAKPLSRPPAGAQIDVTVIERPISSGPETW